MIETQVLTIFFIKVFGACFIFVTSSENQLFVIIRFKDTGKTRFHYIR